MLCSILHKFHRLQSPKILTICMDKNFSSKRLNQPVIKKEGEEATKKPKRPFVPRITLVAPDENVSVTTLEAAEKLSKRRDLKLVKIVDLDTKTQRPVYKLMTGAEYHVEDVKQREIRKREKETSNAVKGEKLLMVGSNISEHDLETYVKKIEKWIGKKYEVRVVINGNPSSTENAEKTYHFLEDRLKDDMRFMQKRTKGNDIKFQILPPKINNDNL